jgi:predicted dehydrogenase
LKIGLIGCGFIGRKRAQYLGEHQITCFADTDLERAIALSKEFGSAKTTTHWKEAIEDKQIDAVIIATTHDSLAPIALAAAQAGKHILIEKPGARSRQELEPVLKAVEETGVIVKVGFNHRFHPAFIKGKEIFDSGVMGPLMFIRGRYGHGGRVGYEKEWRMKKALSGGGELIDQGMHLIDLSRWFLGDFEEATGYVPTYYWESDVEDNAFISLKTLKGQMAWLHATWTEWKNLFSFEIYGKYGKLHINGLGGSYGLETLTYYQMLPEMGPPETSEWEFPPPDESWKLEFEDFTQAVAENRQPQGNLDDCLKALEIVDKIYQRASLKIAH